MSIKIMTKVWEESKQGGSPLLLLLAIADNANDSGFAWPGQEYLAKKIRMNKKSIPRLAKKLQEAGELFIYNRADQGKVTQYIVTVGMSWADFAKSLQTHLKYSDEKCSDLYYWFSKSGVDKLGGVQVGGGTQLCPGGVDIAVSRGVDIAMSTEPSLTVNETSILNGSAKKSQNKNGEDGFDRADQAERDNLNFIADQLARVTKIKIATADEPTIERLKKAALLGYHLAEYCQISLSKLKPRQINDRWQYSKALEDFLGDIITLTSDGVTTEDLMTNKKWWYNEYWLGRDKHQPPTSAQVCATWGQFEAAQSAPASTATGPVLSDEAMENYKRLLAQQTK